MEEADCLLLSRTCYNSHHSSNKLIHKMLASVLMVSEPPLGFQIDIEACGYFLSIHRCSVHMLTAISTPHNLYICTVECTAVCEHVRLTNRCHIMCLCAVPFCADCCKTFVRSRATIEHFGSRNILLRSFHLI